MKSSLISKIGLILIFTIFCSKKEEEESCLIGKEKTNYVDLDFSLVKYTSKIKGNVKLVNDYRNILKTALERLSKKEPFDMPRIIVSWIKNNEHKKLSSFFTEVPFKEIRIPEKFQESLNIFIETGILDEIAEKNEILKSSISFFKYFLKLDINENMMKAFSFPICEVFIELNFSLTKIIAILQKRQSDSKKRLNELTNQDNLPLFIRKKISKIEKLQEKFDLQVNIIEGIFSEEIDFKVLISLSKFRLAISGIISAFKICRGYFTVDFGGDYELYGNFELTLYCLNLLISFFDFLQSLSKLLVSSKENEKICVDRMKGESAKLVVEILMFKIGNNPAFFDEISNYE